MIIIYVSALILENRAMANNKSASGIFHNLLSSEYWIKNIKLSNENKKLNNSQGGWEVREEKVN